MKKNTIIQVTILSLLLCGWLFNACSPLREFGTMPVYNGAGGFTYHALPCDTSKKTIVVVANNDGTELFDMMAPFYLFNATEQANVYVVAKTRLPIVVKKGIYVLPQFSFDDFDALHVQPDVIVIPFLSAADSVHQDPVILNWIRAHYMPNTIVLAVCDGAATAAATGIFDGKPITAHASDFDGIRAHFSKPVWTRNVGVANDGNLFSTAGVSNATEGSLMVIHQLFGPELMKRVIETVNYPSAFPKLAHQSNIFSFGNKASVGKKILFRRNKKLGVLLSEGIDEFELAAVMDTYNRTFPKSIESFAAGDQPVKSRYGLTIIPSGKISTASVDELHFAGRLQPGGATSDIHAARYISYDRNKERYIIDECLERINLEYGPSFETVVKLMLDYN